MDNENHEYPLSEPTPHTPPPRPGYSPAPVYTPSPLRRPGPIRRFFKWIFRSFLILIFVASIAANITFLFSFMTGTGGFTAAQLYRDGKKPYKQIALIDLSGSITMETAARFRLMLNEAREDITVNGVIIVVNSPGGQVVPSDLMARYLKDFKKACPEKRVYTSIEQVGASGAYWATAATDKIFADTNAMVGSIGVIYTSMVVKNTLDKLGVKPIVIKSSKAAFKDQGSPFREPSEQERAKVLKQLDTTHQRFVTVVANGRGLSEEKVWTLATGDIFDGPESLENNLIDQVGTLDDVIAAMETDMGLKNCQVIRYVNQPKLSDILAAKAQSFNNPLDLKKQAENLLSEPRIQAKWMGY